LLVTGLGAGPVLAHLLEGCFVECPLRASTFDLRTWRPSGPPATRAVRTHVVTVLDGTIFVELAVAAVTP